MRRHIFTLIISLIISIAYAQDNGVRYHTIEKGETLFRLTQIYNVTAEAICQMNPGLSAANFQIGKTIAIPQSIGQVEQPRIIETVETDRPADAIDNCREIHKVKKKETIFSITHLYNITEQELLDANPEMKSPGFVLKKGKLLCIPYKTVTRQQIIEPTTEELFSKHTPQAISYQSIHVSLVLPFSNSSRRNIAKQYYNGFLMAVDSLKQEGVNMDITICDSGKNEEKIDSLLRTSSFAASQLIIGPFIERQQKRMAEWCRQNGVRLALSHSAETQTNPYVWAVNPEKDYLYSQVSDFFLANFATYQVIILDMKDKNNDSRRGDFTTILKKKLTDNNIVFKFLAIDSSDEQIEAALDKKKKNIIVPNSASINILERQFLPRWTKIVESKPAYYISLFGHQEWMNEANSLKAGFYTMNTYIYTKYFLNPARASSKRFQTRYNYWFDADLKLVMPSAPILAFDTSYYLIKGLSRYGSEFENNLDKFTTEPYQNFMSFSRNSTWGGMTNLKIAFAHFYKGKVNLEFK